MIDEAARRTALGQFPAGTPLLVVAPAGAGFTALLAERADPAVGLRALDEVAAGDGPVDLAVPHVLLEGLEDLAEPEAFLAGLRARTPQARLFALVANAAHVRALGAFYLGRPLAAGHPLVRGELEPLFAGAGWQPLAIRPIRDAAVPAAAALPIVLTIGPIGFTVADPATLERAATAGFLVIADPR
jgi:hypothetical protein